MFSKKLFKANDMIMFNQKKTAAEMKEAGLVGHVFADDEFQQKGLICSHFD